MLDHARRACRMYESKPAPPTTSSINFSQTGRPGGLESTGSKPPKVALGSKRQIVAAPAVDEAKQRRRDRYADQRTAAAIYRNMSNPEGPKQAGRGVSMCSWTQIAGQDTRLVRVESHERQRISGGKVETQQVPTRAFMRGLQVCGLRWVCPCCTVKKSEACRDELNAALSVARTRGLQPVMLTLTARHKRSMSLADIQGRIALAEKRMKTSRPWKELSRVMTGGFAKAVEITHGENGWHPHFHLILLLECDSQPEAFEEVEELRDQWLHQLNRVGLDGKTKAAKERSFDYCGAEEAGEYVSKWGAGEEMTLAGSKVGHGKGRTPWQLLRDARTAETNTDRQRAAALWWEFVQVMKGVHQLRQSPAFREIVAAYRPPETGEQIEPVETDVMNFGQKGGEGGLWVFARYRQLLMVEEAERGSIEDATERVQGVMLGEQTDSDLWTEDPPPLIDD